MSSLNVSEKPNSLVPGAADLDAWSRLAWVDGIQIDQLKELDRFSVETMNHTYDITVVNPKTAEVLIRGGSVFPEARSAYVSGASLGRCCIKAGGIYVGFHIELLVDDRRVITSRVRSIREL